MRLGDFREPLQDALALGTGGVETFVKTLHRRFGRRHKQRNLRIIVAPLVDFAQTVAHLAHQSRAALGVREQIVDQIRIALHHPNIAQHFKQHPRRAAGFALRAQVFQRLPGFIAQQADDDFAVGVGSIVVGDFAHTRGGGGGVCGHGGVLLKPRLSRAVFRLLGGWRRYLFFLVSRIVKDFPCGGVKNICAGHDSLAACRCRLQAA